MARRGGFRRVAAANIADLAAVMLRHVDNVAKQRVLLRELMELASQALYALAAAEAETVRAILLLMEHHPWDDDVHLFGCTTLTTLSEHALPRHRDAYRAHMYSAGALPAVL